MIYDLVARIRYVYDPPAAAGRNLLRLLPADLPGRQRLIAGQVTGRPAPDERGDRADFFGNKITEMVHRLPAPQTEFILRARVERLAPADLLDLSPPLSDLATEIEDDRSLAPEAPHHFLGPSPRVPASDAITAFARDATQEAGTVREAVEQLGRGLHSAMTFDAEATTVDTLPDEAFADRRGVCQDFAHVMIAGLRGIGVPAGYVSGFLRTVPPPGRPRLEGADAMHAWVRAWCGADMGWIEFDPTNGCEAGDGHVVVAYGRDYDDVAPVQGVLRSAGGRRGGHSVDMRAITG
ncbi:MAG: transglutaminase domain-containing protein [Gemmobacter sp.]